jgi:hypothetical protein
MNDISTKATEQMSILFHYCKTTTFYSILKNNEIHLSSLRLSNDTLEGKIISNKFAEFSAKDDLSEGHRTVLNFFINSISQFYHCGAFCLSDKPDSLSQWRGYADDGHGFSIGFTKNYLQDCISSRNGEFNGLRLEKVIYDEEQQNLLAKTAYDELRNAITAVESFRNLEYSQNYIKNPADRPSETASVNLNGFFKHVNSASELYRFKTKAFEEESEWRLLYDMSTKQDKLEFRPLQSLLIPYKIIKIVRSSGHVTPIRQIMIGPKNETPIEIVRQFTMECGFPHAQITKSSASYK